MAVPPLSPGQRFRPNAPDVTSDSAYGEVIILNMETGAYYGLEQEGAVIWSWVLSGRRLEEIEEALLRRYPEFSGDVSSSVKAFLQELLDEKILVPDDGTLLPPGAGAEPAQPDQPPGPEFFPPVLSKYTDMQELLMIDPVHEVDDRGWPHLPVRDA